MTDIVTLIDSMTKSQEKYESMITDYLESLSKELVIFAKSTSQGNTIDLLEKHKMELYKEINKFDFSNVEFLKAYLLIYSKAILDVKQRVSESFVDEENSLKLLKSYKHLSNLIENLYTENSLSHQELADRMEISKSNLSNFVNKPDVSKLIIKRKYNKKVYYSISGDGHKLYKYIVINKTRELNAEQYTGIFIRIIDSIQTELSSDKVNINRFWSTAVGEKDAITAFTKTNTLKNKLNKLIETIKRQKPYSFNFDHNKVINSVDKTDKFYLENKKMKGNVIYAYK